MVDTGLGPRFIGILANRIAKLSRHFLRTLATQVVETISAIARRMRRIASWLWRLYTRIEISIATVTTDLLLLVWSIRTVALVIAIEVLLVVFGTRWRFLWGIAVVLGILIATAIVQTVREMRSGTHDQDEMWPQGRPMLVNALRAAVRMTVLAVSLYGTWLTVGRDLYRHKLEADSQPSDVQRTSTVYVTTQVDSSEVWDETELKKVDKKIVAQHDPAGIGGTGRVYLDPISRLIHQPGCREITARASVSTWMEAFAQGFKSDQCVLVGD